MKPIYFLRPEPKQGWIYRTLRLILYGKYVVFSIPVELVIRGGGCVTVQAPIGLVMPVQRCHIARFTRIRDLLVFKLYRLHGKVRERE